MLDYPSRSRRVPRAIGSVRFALALLLITMSAIPALAPIPSRAQPCLTETELNDTPESALAITGAFCLEGMLPDGDQDLVLWTVTEEDEDQRWTISVHGIPDTVTTLRLFRVESPPDASPLTLSSELLAISTAPEQQSQTNGDLLMQAGVYLLGISRSATASGTLPMSEAFAITITPGALLPAGSNLQLNDELGTATPVPAAFALDADDDGTGDWYAWSISDADASSGWELRLQVGVGLSATLELLHPDGHSLVWVSASRDGRAFLYDLALPPGTYGLSVAVSGDGPQRYFLESAAGPRPEFDHEPNDTVASASPFDPTAGVVTGRLGREGDVDTYRLTVDAALAATLFDLKLIWRNQRDRSISLLAADETELQRGSGQGGVSLTNLLLAPGDYFLRISGEADLDDQYLLRLDATVAPEPNFEIEPNDSVELAAPFSPNGDQLIVRGRLGELDQDVFRLPVTGQPQLWLVEAEAAGVTRLDVLDITGSSVMTNSATDGRPRLSDVFFLPGDQFIAINGDPGEYTITATPLGPPDPQAEREPNNLLDRSQPLLLAETRTGRLPDPEDVDVYRFALQNESRIVLQIDVPEDAIIQARLDWSNFEVVRLQSTMPGEELTYDALLPPGDFAIWLSPVVASEGYYSLSVHPSDPLNLPDDIEPNNSFAQGRPMPQDLSVSGNLDPRYAYSGDTDVYRIDPLAEPLQARMEVEGSVSVELIVPEAEGSPETLLPLSSNDDGTSSSVDLPAETPIMVRITGSGDYRVSLRQPDFSGLFGGIARTSLPVSLDLTLPETSVAAYWAQAQRLDAELTLTNVGNEQVDLILDAVTGHYAWTVEFDASELTLDPGGTRTMPIRVVVAPDAWADQPVLVTVRATGAAGARTASATLVPSREAPPFNPEQAWPLPPALLGGMNVAWSGLGAAPESVDDAAAQMESNLYDSLTVAGFDWSRAVSALPQELIVDLAGDEPVPVAGITLITQPDYAFAGSALRMFELELSLDGQTFTPALSGELLPLAVEQAFVIDEPVAARFALLRIISPQLPQVFEVTLSQWKVIAQPGWSPSSLDSGALGPELADPARGGHIVDIQPQLGSTLDFQGLVSDDEQRQFLPVEPGSAISWIVGFRDNRAAQLAALSWIDPPESDPALRFESVLVEVSLDSPTGPWQVAATWTLDRYASTGPRFNFAEPTWARFVRFTGITDDGGVDRDIVLWELPGAVRVWERAPDEMYRSILGEWGHYRSAAVYELLVPPPEVSLDPDAGDDAAGATPLPLGQQVTDSAWVGQDEDWYQIEVPPGEDALAITLTGEPTMDVDAALFDADGSGIPLAADKVSPRETVFTAAVEPGATYYLRVTEPPTSVVFAFDTSGSIGAHQTTVYQALNRYAGDVKPGHEAVNVIPFGGTMLLTEPADEPYLLQATITNYPQTESSSNAEGALLAAMEEMSGRPGIKAIILITDASSSPLQDELQRLWSMLGAVQPRVYAVHIAGGREHAATYQHLMQDWSAVNNGIYTYVVTQGEMDVAFDRAATNLRRPSIYGLVVETTERPAPTPTAELAATPEPAQPPAPTATPEPGYLQVVAPDAAVESGPASIAGTVSVSLILDTSGSMLQLLEGSTRADVAKAALIDLVTTTLPPETSVSLRAFGTVPDSCESRLVVSRQPLDPATMAATIQGLEVVNLVRTPLGASLAAVAEDLSAAPGPKIVVLVTDGEETCQGDPEAAIQALIDSGVDVRVNIVGFALDDASLKAQFEAWAQLGNGQYIDAGDAAELAEAVTRAVQPTYEVIDSQGMVIATGQVGGPEIEVPAGTYRVIVLTEPVRTYVEIVVPPGQGVQLEL